MKRVLETERLVLRDMTQEDFEALSLVLTDKAAMYAFDHEFTKEDISQWLHRQIRRYEAVGFGIWAMILKETGEFIGQAGLALERAGEEEVLAATVLLKHAFWHMGYSEEALSSCKRYAFSRLHAPRLCSILRTEDIASQKVAKAFGMQRVREFTTELYGQSTSCFLYDIWQRRSPLPPIAP